MDTQITAVRDWFRRIYLDGVPILLQQNDTSFLSFLCVVAATDALSGYRFRSNDKRFSIFVTEYFPRQYKPHADNLYRFRCRMLHNFSPAYFSLVHAMPAKHLQPSAIGDTILNDQTFFSDMRSASEAYFTELDTNAELQSNMLARLQDTDKGGSISVSG